MAEQYRARADEWACVKARPSGIAFYSCLLELRDRIEALEAPKSGSIDLSHLSDAEREKILKQIANPGTFEVLEVAQPAHPNHPAKPDSSLVDQVEDALDMARGDSEAKARAAIRAVAAWLSEHAGGTRAAWMLEREAER